MKLRELKAAIDKAAEHAGGCDADIEVWFKKRMYRIARVGQFGVVPNVTLEIGEMIFDLEDDTPASTGS